MKNLSFLLKRLLFLGLPLMIFWSCKKAKVDYPLYPLELKADNTSTGLRLTWSKVEASDFVEYVVVRSLSDSIPDFQQLQGAAVSTIARITNLQQNTFTDLSQFSNQTRLFYRVFARLEKRTLATTNYIANGDLISLSVSGISSSVNEIVRDDSKGYPRLFIAGFSNTIALYDDKSEKIVATSSSVNSSSRLAVASDKNGGSVLLQWNNFFTSLSFYNTANLALIKTVSLNPIVSVCGTNDGLIAVLTTNGILQMYDMMGSTPLNFVNLNTFIGNTLAQIVKHPTERKFYIRYFSGIKANVVEVNYDNNGAISPPVLLGTAPDNSVSINQVLEISPQGNILTFGISAFGLAMQELTRFSSVTPPSDVEFSKNGSKIYAARNVTNQQTFFQQATIDEFDIPTFKLLGAKNAKINCLRMFVVDDLAYIIGSGNSGQLVLQKMKL